MRGDGFMGIAAALETADSFAVAAGRLPGGAVPSKPGTAFGLDISGWHGYFVGVYGRFA